MSRIEYTPNPPPQSLTEQSSKDLALYLQNELAQISNFIGEITDVGTVSNPNLLINGGFDIWQRGTSATVGAVYLADRWRGLGGQTVSRSNNVPLNQGATYSLEAVRAGNSALVYSSVELNKQGAPAPFETDDTPYVLSAWVKTADVSVISCRFAYVDAVGSSTNRTVVATVSTPSQLSAATWTKIELPVVFSSTDVPAASNVALEIYLNNADATGGSLVVTNVKLEKGSVATPYQARPIGEEVALCQRYFNKTYILDVPPATSTSNGRCLVNAPFSATNYNTYRFPVEMRAKPSITLYGLTGSSGVVTHSSDGDVAGSTTSTGTGGTTWRNAVSVTAGQYLSVHITADAEL